MRKSDDYETQKFYDQEGPYVPNLRLHEELFLNISLEEAIGMCFAIRNELVSLDHLMHEGAKYESIHARQTELIRQSCLYLNQFSKPELEIIYREFGQRLNKIN